MLPTQMRIYVLLGARVRPETRDTNPDFRNRGDRCWNWQVSGKESALHQLVQEFEWPGPPDPELSLPSPTCSWLLFQPKFGMTDFFLPQQTRSCPLSYRSWKLFGPPHRWPYFRLGPSLSTSFCFASLPYHEAQANPE